MISDTSPIWALAYLNRLDLLARLFDQVLVPPAVARELRSPRGSLPPMEVGNLEYVLIQEPSDWNRVSELLRDLDPGESEALTLAIELDADAILIDEAAGRSKAKQLGLSPVGTLGLLVRAKQRGLIELVSPLIDVLEGDLGFFVSGPLRAEVVRLAGED